MVLNILMALHNYGTVAKHMNLLETVDTTDLTTIQVLMNYLWNINSGDMIFNETETDAIYLL